MIEEDFLVLNWWKEKYDDYKYLSILVRIYLGINPTSVAEERVFTKTGYTIN